MTSTSTSQTDLITRVVGACHPLLEPEVQETARAAAIRRITTVTDPATLARITGAVLRTGDPVLADRLLAHVCDTLPPEHLSRALTLPEGEGADITLATRLPLHWEGLIPCVAAGRLWRHFRQPDGPRNGYLVLDTGDFARASRSPGITMLAACIAADPDLDWTLPETLLGAGLDRTLARWRLNVGDLPGEARRALDHRLAPIDPEAWVAAFSKDALAETLPALKSAGGVEAVARAGLATRIEGTRRLGLPGVLRITSHHHALALADAVPDEDTYLGTDPDARPRMLHDALAPFYPPEILRPPKQDHPDSPEARAKRAARAAKRTAREQDDTPSSPA